jgi:hypothetical protein
VTEPLSDEDLDDLMDQAAVCRPSSWDTIAVNGDVLREFRARLDVAEAELAATRKVVEAARQMDRRNEMSEAAAGWYEDAEALSVAIAELDSIEKAQ